MTMEEHEFDRLLPMAIDGDAEALLEMLVSHQTLLFNFIEKSLGSHLKNLISADDILQETFIHAFNSVQKFSGSNQIAFVAWLKAVATNRIRDFARKTSAAKRGGNLNQIHAPRDVMESRAFDLIQEISDAGFTPSFFAARREAVNALQAALMILPQDQRDAIRLHCFEKMTVEATADRMQRSPDSIRGLIQRGKQALKRCMQNSSKWFSNY